ncbi:MAG: hypothetical protein NZM37_00095 [Sandaracinaceae bacterium]|nr:hypothetical protein [Sandaracinaceae bacterium]
MKTQSVFVCLGWWLVSLGAIGCSGYRPLRLELSYPVPCASPQSQPVVFDCIQIRLCDPSGRECAKLVQEGGDHAAGTEVLLVRGGAGFVRIDAKLESDREYVVEVIALKGREALAVGRALLRERAQGRIWLHPTKEWRCLPFDNEWMFRAFHSGVVLPDGNALVIGGLRWPPANPLDPNPIGRGPEFAELVPAEHSVLLYDAKERRLYKVTARGSIELLERAFFEARWVGRDPNGRERIWLLGGAGRGSKFCFRYADPQLARAVATTSPDCASGALSAPVAALAEILLDPRERAAEVRALSGEAREITLEPLASRLGFGLPPMSSEFDALLGASRGSSGVVSQVGAISVNESGPDITLGPTLTMRRGATINRFGNVVTVFGAADGGGQAIHMYERNGRNWMALTPRLPDLVATSFHKAYAFRWEGSSQQWLWLIVGGVAPVDVPPLRLLRWDPTRNELGVEALGGELPSMPRVHQASLQFDHDGKQGVVVTGGLWMRAAPSLQVDVTNEGFWVEVVRGKVANALPPMSSPRFGHSILWLPDGELWVMGGVEFRMEMGVPVLRLVDRAESLGWMPGWPTPTSCE